MGMYDYIKCKMKLPGKPPSFVTPDYLFQTKDFACQLATYEIDVNGKIADIEDWTGELRFYSSNWSRVAYGLTFTKNGEDYESVEYKATVINGVAVKIEELEKTRKPALSNQVYDEAEANYQEPEIDMSAPKAGQTMWLQYGGGDKGREITIALISPISFAYIDEHGVIRAEYLNFLGSLLFHSKDDCEKVKNAEQSYRQQMQEYFQSIIPSF